MTHEKFEGERTLMRIHIGESDKWHGKALHEAIVEVLRKEGLSGATVLRGVGGYGGTSVYHTDKLLRLSVDLGEGSPRTIVSGIAEAYAPEPLEAPLPRVTTAESTRSGRRSRCQECRSPAPHPPREF